MATRKPPAKAPSKRAKQTALARAAVGQTPAENDAAPTGADEPIAPLWDLPEQSVRIPVSALTYTVVYRLVTDERTGESERAHCGNLGPAAGPGELRRQYGAGRYFLQARCGQRIVAGRHLTLDGPEAGRLPFGPVGELPSGLVTLTQADPVTAGMFALFQVWVGQMRDDFQRTLALQQSVLEKLAGQFGAGMVASHLKENNAELIRRVRELEQDRDRVRDAAHEVDLERVRAKAKAKAGTDWEGIVASVAKVAPPVLEALPPRVKGFLESLVPAGESLPAAGLPPGVVEPPAGG